MDALDEEGRGGRDGDEGLLEGVPASGPQDGAFITILPIEMRGSPPTAGNTTAGLALGGRG